LLLTGYDISSANVCQLQSNLLKTCGAAIDHQGRLVYFREGRLYRLKIFAAFFFVGRIVIYMDGNTPHILLIAANSYRDLARSPYSSNPSATGSSLFGGFVVDALFLTRGFRRSFVNIIPTHLLDLVYGIKNGLLIICFQIGECFKKSRILCIHQDIVMLGCIATGASNGSFERLLIFCQEGPSNLRSIHDRCCISRYSTSIPF
jgi:hypothetical protein